MSIYKKSLPNIALSKLTLAIFCANSALVAAAPSGGVVTNGTANIEGSTITQTSNVVTIDWNTFNVGSNETVKFVQDSSDVAINNILDANPSSILGSIEAGGTVFLSNPNGFIFGVNSSVNTGSFLATTLDIGYVSNTLTLTSNAQTGNDEGITINTGASIKTSGTSENGGYLAFISKNISSETGDPDSSSGLYSEQSEVLLSNNVTTSIKLSGLDINFDISNVNDSDNYLDLTNKVITAKTIILNSAELSGLLNSAITQPASITADHLKISADSKSTNITSDLINTLDVFGTNNNRLAIGKLSLEDKSNNGHFNITSNIDIKDGIDLELSSSKISFTEGNLFGTKESDIILNGHNVNIGYFDDNFGGAGLGSLTINNGELIGSGTYIQGNIRTINDLTINGDTTVTSNPNNIDDIIKFLSDDGSISLKGFLTKSNSNGKLSIRAGGTGGIELGETTGFSEIDLITSKLTLNGNLKASSAISINNIDGAPNTEVRINSNIELESENTSIEDFFFTSNSQLNTLDFNVLNNGSVSLSNSYIDTNNTSNNLDTINVNNIADISNAKSTIIIGGEFNHSNFLIGNNNAPTKTYELSLSNNTVLNNIENLDLTNAELSDASGNYTLTAIGKGYSTASFERINNLNGLILINFNNVTFTDNILTGDMGLSVNSTDDFSPLTGSLISFDAENNQNPITISNNSGGEILLNASTTSNNNSELIISSTNSDITLASIDSLKNIKVIKDLDEGSVIFNGDIKTTDSITLINLGEISIKQDFEMATLTSNDDSGINISNSQLAANQNDITLTSHRISVDSISGNNLDLNAPDINLFGDINALGNLSLLSDAPNEIVNITLSENISLSGNIDFLSSQNNTSNFIGVDKHLDISARNSNIYMHTFDQNSELSSLSVTSTNEDVQVSIFFNKDLDSKIILPTLNNIQGLSLLGGMNLSVGADQTFDTSFYNGQLDFSGVNMIGSGKLTFDTGTGELSLGDIQSTSEEEFVSELAILSSDKLNLHGSLDIQATELNFSELNAIELHTDLTLGSPDIASQTTINLGSATINGTHDLTLYSKSLTLGTVGNNIALQDLTIIDTSDALSFTNDISVVGTVDIKSNAITLDNTISSSGLNVNISTVNDLTMLKDSKIIANYGDINLNSSLGNIGLGTLTAGQSATVSSESGFLFNNIADYVSNLSTSTNITSENQFLYGLTNIGESVSNPIVINVKNSGSINAESTGTIFIANLANANVNATGRLIDGSTGGNTASTDALTQLKLNSLNTINLPTVSSTLGLISNLTWQVDEDESIRKIQSPTSSPAIYHSRSGWRLGPK